MSTYGKDTLILHPDEIQMANIKKHLNEDPDRFENNLKLLEIWMEKHPFIPKNYDKKMLESYFRSCKQDMERTKQKLQLYFLYKKKSPECFKYHEFSDDELPTLNNFYFFPAPRLTPEGHLVLFTGFRNTNLDNYNNQVIAKIIWMMTNYSVLKAYPNSGQIVVLNGGIYTAAMAAKSIDPVTKKIMSLNQTVYPLRLTRIFIINAPAFIGHAVNFFIMLLSSKIRDRVNVDTGDENLRNAIPLYCIPKDLGGSAPSTTETFNRWLQLLKEQRDWWTEQEQLEIGDIPDDLASCYNEDSFSVQGSFRKLNID